MKANWWCECGATFESNLAFRDHSQTHMRLLNCEVCGWQFSSPTDLIDHNSNVHPDFVECHNCSKFMRDEDFVEHAAETGHNTDPPMYSTEGPLSRTKLFV